MGEKSKVVDQYIAKAQPFAKPILTHLRDLVHRACPEAEEKIKWGFPHFEYHGEMMCSMAGFKEHAVFGFWKASLLNDPKWLQTNKEGMGHFGKMQSLKDIPPDTVIARLIKQAMKLNDSGVKVVKSKPAKAISVNPPEYFLKALRKNKAAFKTFEAFSPGNKRDYVDWITEAKTEETRTRRMETAVEWIAEGKIRNWKYLKK